jgi:arylsulfatase A-like enzyme
MNVIWIITDTLRRDHLGAYGNKTIKTPSLDAFAEKSVRFDRHYIAGFPTMPTRADYLTGRWTMTFMDWEPFCKAELDNLLPKLLVNEGIHTAAVVDTPFYIRDGMNYDQGFRSFIEVPGQMYLKYVKEEGEEAKILHLWDSGDARLARRYESDCFAPQTFTKAAQWLESHYKEDFFLYIDTWDPHESWDAPAYYSELYWPGFDGEVIEPVYGYWQDTPGYTEEKVRKAHATYCGEITMVDTWLGYFMRRVENMGLLENTAIFFTSDHGFYFGEHGGLFGKMTLGRDKETGKPSDVVWSHSPLYQELTAIPLFIYLPGAKPGVYDGITSAVDLMPTVLEIMGQPVPSRVEGRSLLPAVKDQQTPGRDFTVSARPYVNAGDTVLSVDGYERSVAEDSAATITTDEWVLLANTTPGLSELYNLKDDPGQQKNVIKEHPEKAKELHQMLVKHMRETNLDPHLLEPRLELKI